MRTQNMHVKRGTILDDGVTGIVSPLRATAQLDALAAQHIHDLALAFVTPLRAEYHRGHVCRSLRCEESRWRRRDG